MFVWFQQLFSAHMFCCSFFLLLNTLCCSCKFCLVLFWNLSFWEHPFFFRNASDDLCVAKRKRKSTVTFKYEVYACICLTLTSLHLSPYIVKFANRNTSINALSFMVPAYYIFTWIVQMVYTGWNLFIFHIGLFFLRQCWLITCKTIELTELDFFFYFQTLIY